MKTDEQALVETASRVGLSVRANPNKSRARRDGVQLDLQRPGTVVGLERNKQLGEKVVVLDGLDAQAPVVGDGVGGFGSFAGLPPDSLGVLQGSAAVPSAYSADEKGNARDHIGYDHPPASPYLAPESRRRAFDGYASAKPNWIRIAAVIAPFVLWSAIYFVVTAALSLGSGS